MVAVATYGGHAYCRDEWIKNALAVTKGHQVFLLWNGPGKPKKIFPKHWIIKTLETEGMTGIEILLAKHRIFRQLFLKGDFSHLFMLESDTFPPPGTIERFLEHDKPITSAVYMIQAEHKIKHRIPPTVENLQKYSSDVCGKDIFVVKSVAVPSVWGLTNNPPSPDDISYNLSGMSLDEVALAHAQSRLWHFNDALPQRGLVRILASGVGACLIRRDVLEQIDFRIQDGDIKQFTDFMLYWDAYNAGFKSYVDTDVWANHIHPASEAHDMDKWFNAKSAKDYTIRPATNQFS